MAKVGKKTPVWRHKISGQVVCGSTIQEALGAGYLFDVGKAWERVYTLPKEKRIVICDGEILPVNDITKAIALTTTTAGPIEVRAYRRIYSFDVIYVDSTKVIIADN